MECVYVDERLSQKGFTQPGFPFLKPNTARYKTLILQPQGPIEVSNVVRNLNRRLAPKKHESFLELALQENPDLAVIPEYSCPWEVVDRLLRRGNAPKQGTLWLMGCEGIRPDSLKSLIESHPEIVWIYDETLDTPENQKGYLDPVCCVFSLKDKSGQMRIVVVVQFKGQEMADKEYRFEPDNLILGSTRFIFRNPKDQNTIKLVPLICSDSLGDLKNEAWSTDYHTPWLVVHLQLCVAPTHTSFISFRSHLYDHDAVHVEFLSVNWARDFVFAHDKSRSPYGGSTILTRAPSADTSDLHIQALHDKGLYYIRCYEPSAHMYSLNYNEHVFMVQQHKPSQKGSRGPAQGNGRTGPFRPVLYSWDRATTTWTEANKADDGYVDMCLRDGHSFDLSLLESMSVVDRERLLLLSSGCLAALTTTDWDKVENLRSMRSDRRRISFRLAVAQDPHEDSEVFRTDTYARFDALQTILTGPVEDLPICIRDLAGKGLRRMSSAQRKIRQNVYDPVRETGATVAFIGHKSDTQAQRHFALAKKAIDDEKRLVIWHATPEGNLPITDHVEPIITDGSEDRDAINREHDF